MAKIYYGLKTEDNRLMQTTTSIKIATSQGWLEQYVEEEDTVTAYDGGLYLKTEEPTEPVEHAQEVKMSEINQAYEEAMEVFKSGVPESEQKTWHVQESEVKAYRADMENALTPFIDSLASARGISREEMIAKTAAKVDTYTAGAGSLTGKKQGYEDAIKAAETVADVNLISWED